MKTKQISVCIFLVLFCAAAALASPPKVLKTMPENGDMNVKPGPTKIRIQFDQDMGGGMSITGGGEKYPEFIGKPQWVNKRVIIVAAKLKPNHEYEFGINSQSYQNFKNVNGEPAEMCRIWFKTTGDAGSVADANSISPQLTEAQNKAAIEALKTAVTKSYSYNDLKKVDWNAAFTQYNERLLKAKTAEEFARVAGILLAEAKDKHIWLMVNDKHIPAYVHPVTPNANFKVLPKLIPDFQKRNGIVYTGRFPDGIGYILIDSWSGTEKNFEPLFAALKEFAAAPGLVIDVRGNGGGSETVAQRFAGCFVDKPALYAKHQIVNPDDPNGFGPAKSRYLMPNEDGPKYRGKVAVLVGPVVMSSCEAFVLMMKQVPGCKIIGQATQGGSGNPQPHDLGNGVAAYLPCWKAMLPDGTCFEGKGIKPDIPVEASQEKITTADPVVDAALLELRRKQ